MKPLLGIVILVLFLSIKAFLSPDEPTEAERLHAAQLESNQRILHWCRDIPEFQQFHKIFGDRMVASADWPTEPGRDDRVTAFAEVGDRFSMFMSMDVRQVGDEALELREAPKFLAKDEEGEFQRVGMSGGTRGGGLHFGPLIWQRFYESGGDFESLRLVSTKADANLVGNPGERLYPDCQVEIAAAGQGGTGRCTGPFGPTGNMRCGPEETLAELTWQYLGSTRFGDQYELVYKLSRINGSESHGVEVVFQGKPLTVWEDDSRKIVLKPAEVASMAGHPEEQ